MKCENCGHFDPIPKTCNYHDNYLCYLKYDNPIDFNKLIFLDYCKSFFSEAEWNKMIDIIEEMLDK